jgi:ATP-dependent helicase/nuclease subunit A
MKFTPTQIQALTTADAHVIITAGAGSGKTRTLVGRHLYLLEAGLPLRLLVAITFTEKAAREMRTRIRGTIQQWLSTGDVSHDDTWQEAFANFDAARIGTIHSLCAQVLRAHPAEAGLDPAFEVLDENHAALLRARAVESALAWAAADPGAARLFFPAYVLFRTPATAFLPRSK